MDIIDVGPMGLRTSVVTLRRAGTPLVFTLYPMIHLAAREFYDAVSHKLAGHDLVVAEGIRGSDRRGRMITSAYRYAAGNDRLGLVVQPKSMVEVGVPLIWADMTSTEFGKHWQDIPLTHRILASTAAPVFGLYLRWFGTRGAIAGYLELNDDIIDHRRTWDPELPMDKLIEDKRDALLAEALDKIHTERAQEKIDVAVVYGAAHVRPVVTFLMARHGYKVRAGEHMTVFSLI
ncbi:hypothetical protein EV193_103686 [Herbihabitans rhizosphaerae]|uniref:TraB family protein n=1 Tax=Herbihabitans rhizosphaerae TaxID=1872711 RepID=A0A4V2ETK2_9PSEU|nr:hypothetical protein [Herbihabitans rhizosphaerae]RZS41363.1 hypothetical protein EV193_103686 [Herbihabitans rhizosphaerae]